MTHSHTTLTCPACGSINSLEAHLAHSDGVRAVVAALQLGGALGRLVVGYLGLFKPAKSRLTPARQANILEELIPLINAAQFARNGNTYTAPRDAWEAGLIAVTEQAAKGNVAAPLKNHNYLLQIMAGMLDQAQHKAGVKAEARVDQQRSARVVNDPPPQPSHTLPPPEVAAMINKITRSKTV